MIAIQVKIHFEHIYPRFSQDPKLPALSMLCDKLTDLVLRDMAFGGDPRNLKLRGGWRNMRVEAGSRLCDEINGDSRRRVFRVRFADIPLDAVKERFVRRRKI